MTLLFSSEEAELMSHLFQRQAKQHPDFRATFVPLDIFFLSHFESGFSLPEDLITKLFESTSNKSKVLILMPVPSYLLKVLEGYKGLFL